MLSECRVAAGIPCKDLAATRPFYEDTLGLKAIDERAGGVAYECGEGTVIVLFPSMGASDGSFTQAMWECDDLDAEMEDLRARGVTFETYDMEGFRSDDKGVVVLDGERGAWFKDPEGNLLALGERSGLTG